MQKLFRIFVTFIALYASASMALSQSNSAADAFPVLWQKHYGDSGRNVFFDILYTPDNALYAAGWTGSLEHSKGWVVKFDEAGNILWEQIFEGEDDFQVTSLALTTDDGIFAVGHTTYNGHSRRGWVVRLDAQGRVVWEKTFGHPRHPFLNRLLPRGSALSKITGAADGWDEFRAAASAPDGGVYLVGQSYKETDPDGDGWIVHLDADGNELAEFFLGMPGSNSLSSVVATADGDIYVGGVVEAASIHGFLAQIDDVSGDIVWSAFLGNPEEYNNVYALAVSGNGHIYATGDIYTSGQQQNTWVGVFDRQGGKLSEVYFPYEEAVQDVTGIDVTDTGHIFMVGFHYAYDKDRSEGLLIHIDPAGQATQKQFSDDSVYIGFFDIARAVDGSFYLAGHNYGASDTSSAMLIRLAPVLDR